jgi:hypothetical protein
MTTLTNLPYDLYLNISSFLIKKDILGFIYSCKKTQSLLLWCNDDAGVHICLGCDLTFSMDVAYKNLKYYLLQLLRDLKQNSTERTLFSSFFFWDLDRSIDYDKPYLQIQPPAESIVKQEKLISDAEIASGGGPECGGIALCELDNQFKNRWISQHVSDFSKSMDIIILCLDAPFHFVVDTESYYEVTRKHAIKKDWLNAIHNICDKGVLIVMIIINTQPNFNPAMRLLGGVIDALNGIVVEVEPSSLKDIPLFIKAIIKEESQKRKIISDVYKNMAYKHKELSKKSLNLLMSKELSKVNTKIQCVNIPIQNRVKADKIAKELALCKTLQEAIDKGLLESEYVMKRLCNNKYGFVTEVQGSPTTPINTNMLLNVNGLHNINGLPRQTSLCRQQSVAYTSTIISKTRSLPASIDPIYKKPCITKQNKSPLQLSNIPIGVNNTFGLRRSKSIHQNYNRQSSMIFMPIINEINETVKNPVTNFIIEGSVKCYLRNPNVNLGFVTDPLLKLACSKKQDSEQKFRKLLFETCTKQYELYINGGVLSRFNESETHTSFILDLKHRVSEMVNNTLPQITRTFSESHEPISYNRILRLVSTRTSSI